MCDRMGRDQHQGCGGGLNEGKAFRFVRQQTAIDHGIFRIAALAPVKTGLGKIDLVTGLESLNGVTHDLHHTGTIATQDRRHG